MESQRPPEGCRGPTCSYHRRDPAVARCVRCGRFTCAACGVLLSNRNYCRWCASAAAVPVPGGQGYTWPVTPAVPYRPLYRPARKRPVVFPNAPWGVGEAMVIFFAAMAVTLSFSLVTYQVMKTMTTALTAQILLVFFSSCILYTLLIGGTYYSVKYRHGSKLTALGLKLDGIGTGFLWGLGLGVPLFAAAFGLAYVSQKVFGPTQTDYVSQSVNKLSSGVNPVLIAVLFFTLVVLAPVCEEIFFRGYLYPALRNRMDMQPAMLLNGLIFAAVHFEVVGFLPRFLLGYGLSYMYEKNHTLAGPMAGHALYNGLILVLSGLLNIF